MEKALLEKLGWDKVFNISLNTKTGELKRHTPKIVPHNTYKLN